MSVRVVKKKKTAIVPGRLNANEAEVISEEVIIGQTREETVSDDKSRSDFSREEQHSGSVSGNDSKMDKRDDQELEDPILDDLEIEDSNDSVRDVPDHADAFKIEGKYIEAEFGENIDDSESELKKQSEFLESERHRFGIEISQLLERQNEYCDKEDFANADLIDTEIGKIKDLLFEVNKKLMIDTPAKMSELNSMSEAKLLAEIEKVGELVLKSNLEYEEMKNALKTKTHLLEKKFQSSKKIDENYAKDEAECSAQMEAYLVQQSELDQTILAETEQIDFERNEAIEKHDLWNEKVDKLQKELAVAMEKRSEFAMIISSAEMKLGRIHSDFSDQTEQLALIHSAVLQQKEKIRETKTQLGGGITEEVQVEIAKVSMELENSESLMSETQMEYGKKRTELLAKTKIRYSKNSQFSILIAPLRLAQSEFIEASSHVRLLSDSLKASESELSKFKSKSLKTRLLELESDKKEAIASRSFREAKEISDEIKIVIDEIESSESVLALLRSNLSQCRCEWLAATRVEEEKAKKLFDEELRFRELAVDEQGVGESEFLKVHAIDQVVHVEPLLSDHEVCAESVTREMHVKSELHSEQLLSEPDIMVEQVESGSETREAPGILESEPEIIVDQAQVATEPDVNEDPHHNEQEKPHIVEEQMHAESETDIYDEQVNAESTPYSRNESEPVVPKLFTESDMS